MRSRSALVVLLSGLMAAGLGCHSSGSYGIHSPCGPNCHWTCADDCCTALTAKRQARKALRRCGVGRGCDYRDGFTWAYVDVLQGSNGIPPGAPPERYWNLHYRSPVGHTRAQEWFAGYADGVQSAMAEGLGQSAVIPTSLTAGPGW